METREPLSRAEHGRRTHQLLLEDHGTDQRANEGLVETVRRLDPDLGPDLLTYAVATDRGHERGRSRDQSWAMRPPGRLHEMQWQTGRSSGRTRRDLGGEPTDG